MLGVVKLLPELNEVPLLDTEYQLTIPALGTALKVTVPETHINAEVEDVMVGVVLTVATTDVLLLVVQLLAVAST